MLIISLLFYYWVFILIVVVDFKEIVSWFFTKAIQSVSSSPSVKSFGRGNCSLLSKLIALNFAFQPTNCSKLLNLIAFSVLFLLINGTSVLSFNHLLTVSSNL